jgi:hypothetical protein
MGIDFYVRLKIQKKGDCDRQDTPPSAETTTLKHLNGRLAVLPLLRACGGVSG